MKLIYIMDPHCGWCYGNSTNINKLVKHFDDLEVELLVGGMMLGESAPNGGTGLSSFIQSHSPRMEKTTGAQVSSKYYELVQNPKVKFSSLEPCAAIVFLNGVVEEHPVFVAAEVQKLIFQDGLDVTIPQSYHKLLAKLGVDIESFEKNWLASENISETRSQFAKAATMCNGFPALIAQVGDERGTLAAGYFQYDQMVTHIEAILRELR